MSFQVNPVKTDRCLLVTYDGETPVGEILSSRHAANKYLATKHWQRMVVDITGMKSKPTTMELIHLASDLSSDLPRHTRLALVVTPEQTELARLTERVARIEGVIVNHFSDLATARAWVMDNPKNSM